MKIEGLGAPQQPDPKGKKTKGVDRADKAKEASKQTADSIELKKDTKEVSKAAYSPNLARTDQPVTDTIIRLTEDFGEIFDHQTLFYHEIDGQRIMAMFWPWSNQEFITIKLMILTKD